MWNVTRIPPDQVEELRTYFKQQVGSSLPTEITRQLDQLESRLSWLVTT